MKGNDTSTGTHQCVAFGRVRGTATSSSREAGDSGPRGSRDDSRFAVTEGEVHWNETWNDGAELNVMGRAPWQELSTTIGSSGNSRSSGGFSSHGEGIRQSQPLSSPVER